MPFTIRITKVNTWVFLISVMLSFFTSPSTSTYEGNVICGDKKRPQNGPFEINLAYLISRLKEKSQSTGSGVAILSYSNHSLYGFFQCPQDLPIINCQRCFSTIETKLKTCSDAEGARIYLDACFLRYETYNFYQEYLDPVHDKVQCSESKATLSDDMLDDQFRIKLNGLILNVTNKAKANKGFGALEAKGCGLPLYAMAQCWKTVTSEGCSRCLNRASAELKSCSPSEEGRGAYAGCYVRYSTDRFFSNGAEDAFRSKDENEPTTIDVIIMVIVFSVVSALGAFLGYKRLSKTSRKVDLNVDVSMSGLNFKYEILETATGHFDDSRKLGQGGAGSVYRGTLPDGRDVAVKRLFFKQQQWADQFFNEVHLISGIRHKNVVKLLGCSIEGPESLLVYEYVPNRGLDQIVFMKDTIHILSWQQRFTIISGTAEGLAYLHDGSGKKIIHRDIKSSNILLDEMLIPKIADFGLARCVSADKSHVSTAIAGTLGYMAPEYLIGGQLTEKADVYAFGVLVIEVAAGRKNSVFSEGSSSILHVVWRHYKANKICQSIDPSLSGRYPEKEAAKVLQIGLLCTQASVALRPSISEVVQMLKNENYPIPSPKQPPFLNASVISPGHSSRSSTFNSSVVHEEQTSCSLPSSSNRNSSVGPCLDHLTSSETKPS